MSLLGIHVGRATNFTNLTGTKDFCRIHGHLFTQTAALGNETLVRKFLREIVDFMECMEQVVCAERTECSQRCFSLARFLN